MKPIRVSVEELESRIDEAARAYPYPPTPDIAGRVEWEALSARRRPLAPRLAWAIVLLALLSLFAVPAVRARILDVIQLGVVKVFRVEPTPFPGETPYPTPTPVSSILELEGETTLAEVRERAAFPIRLPSYPPNLGEPDRVYLQDIGGPVLVLVWLEPGTEDQAGLVQMVLGPGAFAGKAPGEVVERTSVNGNSALWVQGPHWLTIKDPDGDGRQSLVRLVEGNALIWTEGELTYRLETDLSMGEAVRVAESLR